MTQDINMEHKIKALKIDFYFKRQSHELMKLFYLIARPEDEEKMSVVVLKIIETFLSKNIP